MPNDDSEQSSCCWTAIDAVFCCLCCPLYLLYQCCEYCCGLEDDDLGTTYRGTFLNSKPRSPTIKIHAFDEDIELPGPSTSIINVDPNKGRWTSKVHPFDKDKDLLGPSTSRINVDSNKERWTSKVYPFDEDIELPGPSTNIINVDSNKGKWTSKVYPFDKDKDLLGPSTSIINVDSNKGRWTSKVYPFDEDNELPRPSTSKNLDSNKGRGTPPTGRPFDGDNKPWTPRPSASTNKSSTSLQELRVDTLETAFGSALPSGYSGALTGSDLSDLAPSAPPIDSAFFIYEETDVRTNSV